MLADCLGVGSVVLAVDLAFDVGDVAPNPYGPRHLRNHGIRALANRVELLAHELAAKLTLGISPDEQPRWG